MYIFILLPERGRDRFVHSSGPEHRSRNDQFAGSHDPVPCGLSFQNPAAEVRTTKRHRSRHRSSGRVRKSLCNKTSDFIVPNVPTAKDEMESVTPAEPTGAEHQDYGAAKNTDFIGLLCGKPLRAAVC